jgi:hypothetical protein
LLPLGRAAAPKPENAIFLTHRIFRFYDCFAAEREQAPSPQVPRSTGNQSKPIAMLVDPRHL